MKILRVTTDLELTEHEFPTGRYPEQNRVMSNLIGGGCSFVERVTPNRLYTKLGAKRAVMLVDEEGLHHCQELNPVGSYLYETDIHRAPIVGNVLFVGEEKGLDGIDFAGIREEELENLKKGLMALIHTAKKVRDKYSKGGKR